MIDLLGYIVSIVVSWAALLFLPLSLSVWLLEKYISKIFNGVYEPKILRKIIYWMESDTTKGDPAWQTIVLSIISLASMLFVFILSVAKMKGEDSLGFWWNIVSTMNLVAINAACFAGLLSIFCLLVLGVHFLIKKLVDFRKRVDHNAQEVSRLRAIVLDLAERKNYVMTGEQLDALRAYMSAFAEMKGKGNLELNDKFNRKREMLFALRVIPKD